MKTINTTIFFFLNILLCVPAMVYYPHNSLFSECVYTSYMYTFPKINIILCSRIIFTIIIIYVGSIISNLSLTDTIDSTTTFDKLNSNQVLEISLGVALLGVAIIILVTIVVVVVIFMRMKWKGLCNAYTAFTKLFRTGSACRCIIILDLLALKLILKCVLLEMFYTIFLAK